MIAVWILSYIGAAYIGATIMFWTLALAPLERVENRVPYMPPPRPEDRIPDADAPPTPQSILTYP